PIHTINLSLPPRQRYCALANTYRHEVATLPPLFDALIARTSLPPRAVKALARVFLHRLHDVEQTEELRGMSDISGVPMWLLVAFNVLLDAMMGCSSGGVRINDGPRDNGRMVHFRTLDWDMDELRRVVVCLEFVEYEGGPVVATTVTYVGHVGVLTGVRRGLSVSLNFRAFRNDPDSRIASARYYWHIFLVMLGFRASIASILRQLIVPPMPQKDWKPLVLADIVKILPVMLTTACYLIFCDGKRTAIIEKDRVSGAIRETDQFSAVTNHDFNHEEDLAREEVQKLMHERAKEAPLGMADLLDESLDRRDFIEECHLKSTEIQSTGYPRQARMKDVQTWLETYPVLNECTQYAVVMDPQEGTISWMKKWNQ
ncbi:hypothetical protein BT63DRAFT_361887, partial [Microthyrium microscopicum]